MVVVDNSGCDECGTCAGVCPAAAISLVEKPSVEHDKCILCGNCVKVCPLGALRIETATESVPVQEMKWLENLTSQ